MKKFMSFMLAFLAVLTLGATLHVSAATGDTYTKVTDVTNLSIGDNIIIVNEEKKVALSTTQNTNNRGQATVTIKEKSIIPSATVEIITLEEGTKTGTFAFKTSTGYLQAASNDSNHLKTKATKDDNASWLIKISTTTTTIQAQGTFTHNDLQYNQGSKIFSCYKSGQNPVTIYKAAPKGDTSIKFENNDSTGTINEILKNKGETILASDVENPVREGYSFDGWFTEATAGTRVVFPITVEKTTTYYAHWTKLNTCNITFVDGDLTKPVQAYAGAAIEEIAPLQTKEGFKFAGWFTENGLLAENVVASEGLKLVAHWVKEDVTSAFKKMTITNTKIKEKEGYVTSANIDNINFNIQKVGNYGGKIQFGNTKDKPYITNADSLSGVSKITISPANSQIAIYGSNNSLNVNNYTKGKKFTEANGVYSSTTKYDYIYITNTGNSIKIDTIDIEYDLVEPASFAEVQTKSSLAIRYNTETNNPTNVNIRFGGIVPTAVYNPAAKHGIIVIPSTEASLTTVTLDDLASLKTKNYVMECTPAQLDANGNPSATGEYYQFAWLINNIKNHYDFGFKAYMYEEDNGTITLSKETITSAFDIRDKYLINDTLIDYKTVLGRICNEVNA